MRQTHSNGARFTAGAPLLRGRAAANTAALISIVVAMDEC
jgi:hypothetical protein